MKDTSYNHQEIEAKWQSKWESDKLFTPDLVSARNPYYNLMMFPYPSAEGLHVGNMYAFTGADVHARFNRMKGNDIFEPIGLDGFGIHSENYALKVGRHPKEQAKVSQENYYRQLRSIGNSFDWTRTLQTYDPQYFRWTQWLFIKLFQAGLAYRKKAEVNWCPSCKTVLSDEQVIDGKCERCSSMVEKKDLEQWFFKITDYAERLLQNIEKLDWTEKVKIAQRNWIGRKSGSVISFPIDKKYRFINLHGFTANSESDFHPWLKAELEKKGHTVMVPNLPQTENPSVNEQVEYVIDNYSFDADTVLFGHSLGSVVALKVLERLDGPIHSLVLAAGFAEPGFLDHKRPFENTFDWKFDFEKIKKNVGDIILLKATNDTAVPEGRTEYIRQKIGGRVIEVRAQKDHLSAEVEPEILKYIIPSVEVFTTRPDTLHGATFLVLSPEHPYVHSFLEKGNQDNLSEYIKTAHNKSNVERTTDEKEKTGVFSGQYVINPVNNERIPIWIADYVLMGYGTGAIMAVPGHDQRDYDFAKKYKLPIIQVISSSESKIEEKAYEGDGKLINSNMWNGLQMPKEMDKVMDQLIKLGIGYRKVEYHLRDWLISRQRYWGPPIPMIFCEECYKSDKGERTNMPGWYSARLDDLPVLLPDVDDWKPMGTGLSPLANHPEFYETICPFCNGKAKRETDVSDTFLDSAWYFLGYISDPLITGADKNAKSISRDIKMDQNDFTPWDKNIQKRWLPVKKYIGGAEHSVLHLLYSRFISMVLYDLKFVDFEEPFESFFAHGLIIKDGAKMSKSKGNVVVPDEYILKYGADTLRAYLMFLGPFSYGGDFRDSGIEGMNRFIKRVWKKFSNVSDFKMSDEGVAIMHRTIKRVTQDISEFKYNTAIAGLMEWYNFLAEHKEASRHEAEVFLKLLAPFAPFMTDELWHSVLGQKGSIHISQWPEYNEGYLVSKQITIVIQVNGKKRGEMVVKQESMPSQKDLEDQARAVVDRYLSNIEIKKIIYIPLKIINFVI